jgi:hypothetical protein
MVPCEGKVSALYHYAKEKSLLKEDNGTRQ